jgi:hypothetical protein
MPPFDRAKCPLEDQKAFEGNASKKGPSEWLSLREKAIAGDNPKNSPSNPHTPYVL